MPSLLPRQLHAQAAVDGGRLWRAGRLWVMQTSGGPQERGWQHGRLLSEQISRGAAHVLGARALKLAQKRAGSAVPGAALDRWVDAIYAAIVQSAPISLAAELEGLASGSGAELQTLQRATFLSEALQIMVAQGGDASSAVAHGGCTAAVIARVGGSLHAKNQDYDGGGLWDAFPLVHVARPSEGLAHVSAGTVGILKGNLTLNAAGVTIGGHFLFSAAVQPKGAGFTALEREVALNARTADEAIDIIRGRDIMGSFAFVVTDASGAAHVAECDAEGVTVRSSEHGRLAMSNLFSGAQGQSRDLLRRWGAHRNPLARGVRACELMAALPADAGVEALIRVLRDRWDPTSRRLRRPSHVIAQASTVTSAVADTARLEFWVGEAKAPSSVGEFIGFSVADAFSSGDVTILGGLPGERESEDETLLAFRLFLEARDLLQSGDEVQALARLEAAAKADPSEPVYPKMLTRLLMRAGRFAEAGDALVRADALEQGPNEKAECRLLRGFLSDLAGVRGDAVEHYISVVQMVDPQDPFGWIDPRFLRAAKRWQTHPFSIGDAENLDVSFELTSEAA